MNKWEKFKRDMEWKNNSLAQAAYERAYRQAYADEMSQQQENYEAIRAKAVDRAVQTARVRDDAASQRRISEAIKTRLLLGIIMRLHLCSLGKWRGTQYGV